MNRGLMAKTIREVWVSTLLFGVALAAMEVLIASVIPSFFEESAGPLLKMKFVQNIFRGLLGTEVGQSIGPAMIPAFAWIHPVVLTLLWAHAIMFCTRVPAGEIDRGTIDVLLSLPTSRTTLYLSETIVWLGAGLVVILMGLAGNLIGGSTVAPEFRGAPRQVLVVVLNLYCLYATVGALALLVSALSDRRGRAVGVVFAIVLGSFFLNFLAQFWAPAKTLSVLSVLNYYRPLVVLRDGSWPITDMLVLIAVAATCWTAGAIIFSRRDICTV